MCGNSWTQDITNLQFELDQQIGMAEWQFIQEHRACSAITAQNIRRKSNGSRNWFGRKQVVSPTYNRPIKLARNSLSFILQTKRMDWNLSYQDLI